MKLKLTLKGERVIIAAEFEETELKHFATEVLPRMKQLISLLEHEPVLVFFDEAVKQNTTIRVPISCTRIANVLDEQE